MNGADDSHLPPAQYTSFSFAVNSALEEKSCEELNGERGWSHVVGADIK